VKFLHALDVNTILSNRDQIKSPIIIKLEELKSESILLCGHWNLIKQGINRKSIRIRNGQILVNKQLHGKIVNLKYVKSIPIDK